MEGFNEILCIDHQCLADFYICTVHVLECNWFDVSYNYRCLDWLLWYLIESYRSQCAQMLQPQAVLFAGCTPASSTSFPLLADLGGYAACILQRVFM